MISSGFLQPIAEFANELNKIPGLVLAVLYGSALKGEMHKKSDIDFLLLFDTKGNPEVSKEGKMVHQTASTISKKYNLAQSFSFVMININKIGDADPDFIRNVSKEGVVIWGRPRHLLRSGHPSLEPEDIFSYSTGNLDARVKMAIHRALYGYRVEKIIRGKKYVNESKGIIGHHGERLGGGAVMVPARYADDVAGIFETYGVKYRRIKAWV